MTPSQRTSTVTETKMEKGDFYQFGSTESEIVSEELSETSCTKICQLGSNIHQKSSDGGKEGYENDIGSLKPDGISKD